MLWFQITLQTWTNFLFPLIVFKDWELISNSLCLRGLGLSSIGYIFVRQQALCPVQKCMDVHFLHTRTCTSQTFVLPLQRGKPLSHPGEVWNNTSALGSRELLTEGWYPVCGRISFHVVWCDISTFQLARRWLCNPWIDKWQLSSVWLSSSDSMTEKGSLACPAAALSRCLMGLLGGVVVTRPSLQLFLILKEVLSIVWCSRVRDATWCFIWTVGIGPEIWSGWAGQRIWASKESKATR